MNIETEKHNFEEHVAVTRETAFEFLFNNKALQDFLRSNNMIFVDGYFVVADKKYISEDYNREIHLTQWAKNNLDKCTLNVRKLIKRKSNSHSNSGISEISGSDENDKNSFVSAFGLTHVAAAVAAAVAAVVAAPMMFVSMLASLVIPGAACIGTKVGTESDEILTESDEILEDALEFQDKSEIDKRILLLNSEYVALFDEQFEQEINKGIRSKVYNVTSGDIYDSALNFLFKEEYSMEKQFDKLLGDPEQTLSNCLQFMMKAKGWKNADTFWDKTLLHRNYFYKINNNQLKGASRETLMAICVGLGLKIRMAEKIFNKAGLKLREHVSPDYVYMLILEFFPRISINDFNNLLIRVGLTPLGTPIKE